MTIITCTFDDQTHKVVPICETNDMTSVMADVIDDPANDRSSWDLAENVYQAAIATAPPYPADDGWIPCSERLPEINIPVITSSEFGVTAHCRVDLGDGNWGWGVPQYYILSDCRNYECDDDYLVNFWTPIPAAPKGE